MPDAVVIGSGPNGLVAANRLVDAGWTVTVVEEQDSPGGAVKSAELLESGFVSDLFSSFYPLAVASPALRRLRLEDYGLRWRKSRLAVAHPTPDGTCAVLSTDLDETMRSLDSFAAGDGAAWRRLFSLWERIGPEVLDMLTSPLPPLRPAARLGMKLGASGLLELGRIGALGVRRLAEEQFTGPGAGRLLAGNALHADLTPELPPSAVYGWILCCLGQQFGFPVPEGGAGRLTDALLRRLRERGGEVVCGERATAVLVSRGSASGVELASGERIPAARAVLADVDAPQLYRDLIPDGMLDARVTRQIDRFQYDNATVKVDWTLDRPIPWEAPEARDAGTIHIADDLDFLTRHAMEVMMHRIPRAPFLVFGQHSALDPSRAPYGREVAWAYTHVPQRTAGDAGEDRLTGSWDDREKEIFVARMEAQVERVAPGFRTSIRRRRVLSPREFSPVNRNLRNGALNGGTAQLHQQLVFRPIPGLGRPETPVPRLYLCSASIHPGGGVHGGCGDAGARAALMWDRARRARIPAAGAAVAAGALAAARASSRARRR